MTELELAKKYLQERSLSHQKKETQEMFSAGIIGDILPASEVDDVLELVLSGMFSAFYRKHERNKI